MAGLVKQWNDGSGDVFAVIYSPNGGEMRISSTLNMGVSREGLIKIQGDESIGIKVIQASAEDGWESHARYARGYECGVEIRCIVYLDNKGNPCTVTINRV